MSIVEGWPDPDGLRRPPMPCGHPLAPRIAGLGRRPPIGQTGTPLGRPARFGPTPPARGPMQRHPGLLLALAGLAAAGLWLLSMLAPA